MIKLNLDLKNYTESENIFKRKAVRGIISRNGKYLFIYSKYGDYKFPGGGMEEGETLEMTLFREVAEETGYIVKKSSIKEGFEVLERRRGEPEDILEMKSYYYFCEVEDDTTDRNLDDYEKEYDYKVSWLTLEEAISKNESVEDFENIPWIVRETMVMKNLHNTINNTYIGRVVSQLKDMYKVIVEDVIIYAEVSGKFSYNTTKVTDYPVVGDFVKLDRNSDEFGNAIIHEVLPRKSLFVRMASGTGNKEQAVAANIDYVFICMSLNLDFNLKRLERYITLSFESGAVPVVVLTKADLCEDVPSVLRDVKSVAIGVDILLTSSFEDGGLEELEPYLKKDKTIALIGSSGVGKSTLINCLSNNNDLETNILRNDDKGKHTTTRREMHFYRVEQLL